MHAYLFRSKRSPLNANLARLRRSDPLFRRPALNRIYIYISRLIGDDSASRESIKQIVFGRPTRLFFRPIGVAFLLERLLVISSATLPSSSRRGEIQGEMGWGEIQREPRTSRFLLPPPIYLPQSFANFRP